MSGTASRHSNYERRIQFGNLPRLQTRKNRPTLTTTHNFELQGVIYLRPSLSSLDVRVNAYNLFCSALALISHNQHTIAFVGTPTAQLTQPALFRFLNSQAVASSPTHACAPHHPHMHVHLITHACACSSCFSLCLNSPRSGRARATALCLTRSSFPWPPFQLHILSFAPVLEDCHRITTCTTSLNRFSIFCRFCLSLRGLSHAPHRTLSHLPHFEAFSLPPPAPSQSATQMPSLTNASGNLLPAAAVLHFTGSPKPWNVYVPPTADHFDDSDAEAWSLVQGAAVGGHWAMNVVSWVFRFVLVRGSKCATKTLHYA